MSAATLEPPLDGGFDPAFTPAFERAVAEHQRSVYRVCRSILRDDHLGADAAQETFLRLWRELGAGRAPQRFGAWLRRVAVSASLDLLRRRRSAERVAAALAEVDFDAAALAPDPTTIFARRELEGTLEAAVDELPEGQRTVFLLRHAGGLKLSEVAETLGIAVPTAKTQFARACLKLQARLRPFLRDETR